MNTWEASIWTTGGDIIPDNCNSYVLGFLAEGSSWKYASIEGIPATLTVKDTKRIRQEIQRLNFKNSGVFLGVHSSPFGDMLSQVKTLRDKSQAWEDKIIVGHLNRVNITVALIQKFGNTCLICLLLLHFWRRLQ